MNERTCSILLDLVERKAIEKFPSDREGYAVSFNMTHFLKAAGLNSKSNNLKWQRLRQRPSNLSVADVYRFADAVGLNFIELITAAHTLAKEESFAKATEKKLQYDTKKNLSEKLKKAANND